MKGSKANAPNIKVLYNTRGLLFVFTFEGRGGDRTSRRMYGRMNKIPPCVSTGPRLLQGRWPKTEERESYKESPQKCSQAQMICNFRRHIKNECEEMEISEILCASQWEAFYAFLLFLFPPLFFSFL